MTTIEIVATYAVANDFSDFCRKVAKRLFGAIAKLGMMEKRKSSHKMKLSADAKLIIALLTKQPQTKGDFCKNAGIHLSTFYRIVHLLKERGIIEETKDGFALWTYIELEKAVENALDELEKITSVITFNAIASEVGVHPSEIEPVIYRIAKKRGLEVRLDKREKVIAERSKGRIMF